MTCFCRRLDRTFWRCVQPLGLQWVQDLSWGLLGCSDSQMTVLYCWHFLCFLNAERKDSKMVKDLQSLEIISSRVFSQTPKIRHTYKNFYGSLMCPKERLWYTGTPGKRPHIIGVAKEKCLAKGHTDKPQWRCHRDSN